jgi:hypothetical protein
MARLKKVVSTVNPKYWQLAVWLFLSAAYSATSIAQEALHQPWQALLSQHVTPINNGHSSKVDYAGIKKDQVKLSAYLTTLGAIDKQTFAQWPAPQQLAFLINAYNAWTVELILTVYPDLESIK